MWRQEKFSQMYMEEILQMAKEHYGDENETAKSRFVQHQYFENPSGDAIISLAIDEDTQILAGQYVICPMRFLVHKVIVRCVNSLNTLTRKEYRNQGVFTGLAETSYKQAEEKGYLFCYGVPNPNSYSGFIKKLSFVELGRIPLLLRPLLPSHIVTEYLNSKILSTLAKPIDPFFYIKDNIDNQSVSIISIDNENMALMDLFWDNVKGKYPIMNVRDKIYFRFRYLEMPYRKYYLYLVLQNENPVGLAVGRIMDVAGMRCGMLADFLFADGYEYAAERLLNHLLYVMQSNGASVAGSLMLKHTKESALLRRKGFFTCPQQLVPQPFPLLVRSFDKQIEKRIIELNNWFFTMGDYDVI